MLKNILSFIKKWLFEIIPVFIGVILALYFSNLKEENDRENFVEQLKISILTEIDGNITDLDSMIIGEQAALDTLQHYLANDTMNIYHVLLITRVISFPSLEFSTWSIIQSSGNAFTLSPDLLKEMVSMDKMINYHHLESVNGVGDFLLHNMFKTDREVKMTAVMLLGNNIELEKQINGDLKELREILSNE